MRHRYLLLALPFLLLSPPVLAQTTVEMHRISADGVGPSIGTITLRSDGETAPVTMDYDLAGLEPGQHGFHVHEKPSCASAEKDGSMAAGEAAGPHFDPRDSKSHQGPEGNGHLGDLPALEAAADGTAKGSVVAQRLTLAVLKGHALMVHRGGDNYTDEPENGGGGDRVACGVVN